MNLAYHSLKGAQNLSIWGMLIPTNQSSLSLLFRGMCSRLDRRKSCACFLLWSFPGLFIRFWSFSAFSTSAQVKVAAPQMGDLTRATPEAGLLIHSV